MQTEKRGWWHKKGRYIHVFRSKCVGLHFTVHLVTVAMSTHSDMATVMWLQEWNDLHTTYTEWRYLIFNHPDGLFLKVGLKCGFMWPKDTFPFFIGSSSRLREFSSIDFIDICFVLEAYLANSDAATNGALLKVFCVCAHSTQFSDICYRIMSSFFLMQCCQRVQSHKQSALIFAQWEIIFWISIHLYKSMMLTKYNIYKIA